MINPKMEAAINKQINAESFSAYLYLAMSADADLKGF
ncbi:MAG TPA: ferritin, partial [Candidatus Hydrogenedentes bacterium]|nr:ferritin [Candidatus Hydrogenedentota bacterium]